jgi:NitT/TauT family transport system substrate-binding protein
MASARLRLTIALLACFVVLPQALAQDKIRLGLLPFSESLPAVIADKQGYFKAQGLDVEITRVQSGAQAVPVLQAGKLDIVLSNTVTTLQAMEAGVDATIVAPGAAARAKAPDTSNALMILKDGSVKTPKDLEGKRVAVNVINSTTWLYVVAFLEKHGVDRSKVRFVEIPFPQMNDPLLNKQVDAVGQVEPFRTILEDTGKAQVLGFVYIDVQPNADITQYIALTPWVQKNRAAAQKFAQAIIKGAEYLNANEAAARDANLEFTKLNPALKDKVMLPRFATAVSVQEVQRTQDLMMRYGLMKQAVNVAQRVLPAQ